MHNIIVVCLLCGFWSALFMAFLLLLCAYQLGRYRVFHRVFRVLRWRHLLRHNIVIIWGMVGVQLFSVQSPECWQTVVPLPIHLLTSIVIERPELILFISSRTINRWVTKWINSFAPRMCIMINLVTEQRNFPCQTREIRPILISWWGLNAGQTMSKIGWNSAAPTQLSLPIWDCDSSQWIQIRSGNRICEPFYMWLKLAFLMLNW